jgi:ABC-2 type transport system ATP-binding protein
VTADGWVPQLPSVIRTKGLTKRYGRRLVVDALDLDIVEGDRFGFLGPNGSGKSTTLRMLLGLVFPTAGTAELLGAPLPKASRTVLHQVGSLIEGPAYYGHMSGRANLRLFDAAGPAGSRRTRRERVEEALHRVGMGRVDERPVRAYSLGMKQRLGLAGALLRRPRLLVLDEPTNGLDPQGVHEVRELLAELNREGTTVVLSSHLLPEVEALCANAGRVVVSGSVDELRSPTGDVHVRTPDPDMAARLLGDKVLRRDADRLTVASDDPAALNASLVGAGVRVTELVAQRRSLEEVFLDLTDAGEIPL